MSWYDVPEKARLRQTVGIEAENCSESIHPMVNSLNRRYINIRNTEQKLGLICKSQWLKSNRLLPNFRQPVPRGKGLRNIANLKEREEKA